MMGKLVYSKEKECWYFKGKENHFPISCGEHLQIKIFNKYRPCRVELAHDWYVILDNISFVLFKSFSYDVKYY
ncbi:hypothetical protein SAMN02745227_01523 [Anaerobranca californiensis DSM 14826]|jgi:hypothetical protein|uniref:DUF5348 domain-containing protein n=1 Tax=Anaerobranca californiensis DSM 14826 TaxID=1120989 RepID=A0A1M6PRP6_9FIRM|nr:DUF5348 domain-containing protein [Anaerobranca californiensis]SHK10617.1 hypothetical protein SAMN02745227_01523 [Anaerobranca californiensis DSM 14826]